MTNKEIARNLIDRFINHLWDKDFFGDTKNKNCKICALILVDERLSEIDEYFDSTRDNIEVLALWNHYVGKQRKWLDIRKEIETL